MSNNVTKMWRTPHALEAFACFSSVASPPLKSSMQLSESSDNYQQLNVPKQMVQTQDLQTTPNVN
jgi:hypothetical protein